MSALQRTHKFAATTPVITKTVAFWRRMSSKKLKPMTYRSSFQMRSMRSHGQCGTSRKSRIRTAEAFGHKNRLPSGCLDSTLQHHYRNTP